MWAVKRRRSGGGGASLNLNFTASMPGGVTVVSSPVGYARSSTGLTSFTANAGRRTDLGLVVEPAATNVILYNQQFDNTLAWTPTNCTTTANAVNDPTGSATAEKIQETAVSNVHFFNYTATAVTKTANVDWVYSVYVKPEERTWCAIELYDGPNNRGYFNLSGAGTVGTLSNSLTNGGIQQVGSSGWYRVWGKINNANTGEVPSIQTATGDLTNIFLGVAGSGIDVWNAQFELGATPTTPILTTSAAATRTADNIQFTVPAGITNLTYTFDDNSTQLVTGVSAGTYTIPTNLNRAQIKTIVGS